MGQFDGGQKTFWTRVTNIQARIELPSMFIHYYNAHWRRHHSPWVSDKKLTGINDDHASLKTEVCHRPPSQGRNYRNVARVE